MSDRENTEQIYALKILEEARKEFSNSLQVFERTHGKIYLDRAPELPQELLDECKLLHNRHELLKRLPKDAVVAEVGTDHGAFAAEILKLCSPRKLHIFDIDFSALDRTNIQEGLNTGICHLHEGDSSIQMTLMDDQYFDWIYIDADHFYDGVKKDIAASSLKLKQGGMLIFNDYNVWSPASVCKYGVMKAVNEFCIENDWKFVYLALQSLMYNDVAIMKRSSCS